MKFSQFTCPICGGNDLEVYNSIIDETNYIAYGYIGFECNKCGEIFEEEIEAEVIG